MTTVQPVPDRFHSVAPYLVVPSAVEALALYEKAFGARTLSRMEGPGGSTMHAEMRIGDSVVMMSDENPAWGLKSPRSAGACTCSLHLSVEDCDAVFQRAVAAGCQVLMPPADMFWGDRFCKVADPFGHHWGIATHQEDVSPEEMARRADAMRRQMEQASAPRPNEEPLTVYNEEDLDRDHKGC
jgi:uncharacterized glyoxalase superfamily protein PhnB